MTVDKNPAYPITFGQAQCECEGIIPKRFKLRRIRYLNNIVGQDNRFIRRLVKPGMGFGSFWPAWNRQARGVPKGDILGQARFVSICLWIGYLRGILQAISLLSPDFLKSLGHNALTDVTTLGARSIRCLQRIRCIFCDHHESNSDYKSKGWLW